MARSLLEKERQAARERMAAGGRGGLKGRKFGGPSEALARLARRYHISREQLRKIMEVCEAAEADPDRFGSLLAEMDRTGKVNGPHVKLRRLRDEIRVLGLKPIPSRFRTLVVDPPWCDESVSASQRPPYATMSLAEIAAVPVPSWAEDECHLYLWTTAPFTGPALDILLGWGFTHRTTLIWVKPRWTMGRWFRPQAEHVLVGSRGKRRPRRQDVSTVFEGPMGEHSEKPERFFEIVRLMSYPPYGEAFQRKARPDFTNLYGMPPASLAEAAE